jgi:hypothetical protein
LTKKMTAMAPVKKPEKPDAKATSIERPPLSFPPAIFPAKEAIRHMIQVAREQSSHPHHGRLDGIIGMGGIVSLAYMESRRRKAEVTIRQPCNKDGLS